MSDNYQYAQVPAIIDPTGKIVGLRGTDGKKYLFNLLRDGDDPTFGYTDASGTPGNATINTSRGKVAIAAGQSSVVVTNSLVSPSTAINAYIEQAAADTTCTNVPRVVAGNGSFTIYGNAAATATVYVKFTVEN